MPYQFAKSAAVWASADTVRLGKDTGGKTAGATKACPQRWG